MEQTERCKCEKPHPMTGLGRQRDGLWWCNDCGNPIGMEKPKTKKQNKRS